MLEGVALTQTLALRNQDEEWWPVQAGFLRERGFESLPLCFLYLDRKSFVSATWTRQEGYRRRKSFPVTNLRFCSPGAGGRYC